MHRRGHAPGMLTLYYSPGACSLAPHILLRERALPHQLERVSIGDDEHKDAAFRAVNPLAKLPALVLEDGAVLTEVISILQYLGGPLVPEEPMARARCFELMGLIGTAMHPHYAMGLRPDRVVADPVAHDAMRAAGRKRFAELLAFVDARLPEDQWALGPDYTIADPYLFVMGAWARYLQLPFDDMPRLSAWMQRAGARPAVLAALRAEALIDEQGRPTPPERV